MTDRKLTGRQGTRDTREESGYMVDQPSVVRKGPPTSALFPLTSFSSFIREAVRRAAHIIIH